MIIVGIDEVGRGALAGPVVVAAVSLTKHRFITGLKDSKCVSPKKRIALAYLIKHLALDWALASGTVQEIDQYGIHQATHLAMQRAVSKLHCIPDLIIVDGNRQPRWPYATFCLIKGDQICLPISAASILAKVHRDHMMQRLDLFYPHYGFAKHKGYGTPEHFRALQQHGTIALHRHSFSPCTLYAT